MNVSSMNVFARAFLALTCLAVLLSSASCEAQKNKRNRRPDKQAKTMPTPTVQKPILVASIEMGACYGKCPAYKALIYRPGRMEYYGRKNMPKNDTAQYQLMETFVTNLIQEGKRIKFTSLPDTLPMPTDVSRVTIFMYIDGKKKSVHFAREAAPDELREFTKHFHENVLSVLEEQEPLKMKNEE